MLMHLWLAAVAAQAPSFPPPLVERWTDTAPPPRGDRALRRAMLDAHDGARAAVGVPPLAWDEALARDAMAYASDMARTGRFAHAVQPVGVARQGENLWAGSRGAYRFEDMAAHWIAERRDFVNAAVPRSSRTGRWQDVGHYAQIVWRGTTRFGCALAAGGATDYLVCRYAPAGNMWGQSAY